MRTAVVPRRAAVWGREAWAFDAFVHFVPYQRMLREVASALAPDVGDWVLDAGCGTGNLTRLLVAAGADVVGLDASAPMLGRARGKCPDATFVPHDLNRPLPFPAASFDCVASVHTLYVLQDPPRTLKELARVTLRGGRLVIVHPRPGRPSRALRSHLTSGEFATITASALQLPRFSRLLRDALPALISWRRTACSPEELAEMVDGCGFKTLGTRPTYGGISTLLVAKKR